MRTAAGIALVVVVLSARAEGQRFDEVSALATHNSYWVRRHFELGASGTQERIFDQIIYEGVRAIELDIHARAHQPGVWGVYHTNAESNSVCSPLSACLEQLRLIQYVVPQHEVLDVIVELKQLWGHALDGEHTIAQLDRSFADALGPALYTPREFLSRCPAAPSLRDCARRAGWPTVDRLRGRIIMNVLGNWSHNLDDWVDYATRGRGAAERAAFPMRTILSPDGMTRAVAAWVPHSFTRAQLAAAEASAIFWQVGDPGFAEIRRFLDEHGIVRSTFRRRGFQLLQTDSPWRERTALAADDSRLRLLAKEGEWAAAVFRSSDNVEWQTAPAVGAAARGRARGCLRAASPDGEQWFMLCKRVLDGARLRVSLHERRGARGPVTVRAIDTTNAGDDRAGDLLQLRIEASGHDTCVTAASASHIDGAKPDWHVLGRSCFAVALPVQGLAASGDVVFAGTRRDGVSITGRGDVDFVRPGRGASLCAACD